MHEVLIAQLQAENEKLKRRIAELEHTLEVHEWGTQLFHESDIPQLLLDFETGAILAANAAARTFYGEELIGRGDIMCVCAEGLDWARDIQPLFMQNRYGRKLARQHTASGEVRVVEAHFAQIDYPRTNHCASAVLRCLRSRARAGRIRDQLQPLSSLHPTLQRSHLARHDDRADSCPVARRGTDRPDFRAQLLGGVQPGVLSDVGCESVRASCWAH